MKHIDYYKLRALGQTDSNPVYYVYLLVNPITQEIFYIGKGKNNRHLRHIMDVKRNKITNGINGKLFRYIKSLLDKNLEPLYDIPSDNMPELDALALEAAFIDYYGLNNLCNYQASGFGCDNTTEEMRKKISDKTKEGMKVYYSNPLNVWKQSCNASNMTHKMCVKKYGSIDNYREYKYNTFINKKQSRIERDIKQQNKLPALTYEQKAQHKQDKHNRLMEERLIVKCNRITNEYVKLCPRCKKEQIYDRYESLMSCARHKTNCLECMGKDVSVWMKARHNKPLLYAV